MCRTGLRVLRGVTVKCVEIKESRILAEEQLAEFQKKSNRWKKKLAEQLEADIEKLKTVKKPSKQTTSGRTYRMTSNLAEIELPAFDGGASRVYAVIPEDGEALVQALALALKEKRDALLAGGLDQALLLTPNRDTPAAEPAVTLVVPEVVPKASKA